MRAGRETGGGGGGGATRPTRPAVAQVVLIDGTTNAVSAGEKDLPAPPADKPRRQGIRPATEGLPAAPSLAVIRDPSPAGPAPQSPGVVMRPGGEGAGPG